MMARRAVLSAFLMGVVLLAGPAAGEEAAKAKKSAKVAKHDRGDQSPKAWCAPEVSELSDHTCWFDGGTPSDGRRTLVVYMHGAYATSPGFQWLQQRAMAMHAQKHGFTVLLPTSPRTEGGYVWPTSQKAQEEQEADILKGIKKSRAELERRAGKPFDEMFVVGFSSGAYYSSSLAIRGGLDADGYIVLAGGSSWSRPASEGSRGKRAPIFVGVSAADPQTAGHSRALAGSLASLRWPFKVEERNAGHMVDWTFMTHGISWLRAQRSPAVLANTSAAR
jgi:predicted esterase